MNLCDDGHDEVCFDSRHCPVCEIIKDNEDYTERLQDEIKDLRQQLTDAETEQARYMDLFNEVKSAYPEFAI
jgi:inorganic pyrophosphatase